MEAWVWPTSNRKTMNEAIELMIEGKYIIDSRMMLSLKINNINDNNLKYHALNDIVINHGNSGRILKTEVLVSNKYLNTYESDGLIFSTPTVLHLFLISRWTNYYSYN